jgi:hypothetical protein
MGFQGLLQEQLNFSLTNSKNSADIPQEQGHTAPRYMSTYSSVPQGGQPTTEPMASKWPWPLSYHFTGKSISS